MSVGHLDPLSFGSLAGPARQEALRHLAACSMCRDAIVREAPESLFSLLALEPESPEMLDAVSAGVARRLDGTRPSWIEALRERGLPPSGARLAVAAAVAACGLLFPFLRAPLPKSPALALASPDRAGVTLVEPAPEAQVIDLTVGGTQVVMIFDPELKL